MKINTLLLFVLVLCAGCIRVPTSTMTAGTKQSLPTTSPTKPDIDQTLTPIRQSVPTATYTLTPNPTPPPTETLLPTDANGCLQVSKVIPKGFLSPGVMIFDSYDTQDMNLYKVDTQAPVEQIFSGIPTWYGGHISPNGKWLAYASYLQNSNDAKLYVINSNGKIQSDIAYENHATAHFEWLNVDQLIFDTSLYNPISRIIVNPFISEREEITLDLPNRNNDPKEEDLFWWQVVLNPALDRAIYIQKDPKSGELSFNLTDLIHKNMLWKKAAVSSFNAEPVWNHTGSALAVYTATHQIFLLDRDGKELAEYPIAAYQYQRGFELSPRMTWSHDDRYLTFNYNASPAHLEVIDTHQNTSTKMCLSVDNEIVEFAWSPDDRQWVLSFGDETYPAVVVDWNEKRVVSVVKNPHLYVIGWMTAP